MRINVRRHMVQVLCLLATPVVPASQAMAAPVSLVNPTAQFCQTNFPITEAFDSSLSPTDGWAIDPFEGNDITAIVKTASDVGGSGETVIRFRLYMYWGDTHTIGKFRLSATTSSRSTYGQGATCNDATPAGSAAWTVLYPQSVTSAGGQTLTVQPDGSVLASGGNPDTDVVTFVVTTQSQGITGFRLETLADASLPSNGPGRSPSNGNFVLTELLIDAEHLTGVPTLGAAAMALMALLLAGAGMVRIRRKQRPRKT